MNIAKMKYTNLTTKLNYKYLKRLAVTYEDNIFQTQYSASKSTFSVLFFCTVSVFKRNPE